MEQFKSNPMVTKQDLLLWSGVPRSSFYYKRGDGFRGRKPSKMTITQDGELKEKGYIINHKKVYRLMKIHNLLFNRKIGSIGVPRQFVRFRKIKAEKPLEHLCMDINISISMEHRGTLCY